MIAVPLPLFVQRNEKQVLPLEVIQCGTSSSRLLCNGIAERGGEAAKRAGPEQEGRDLVGKALEHFLDQIGTECLPGLCAVPWSPAAEVADHRESASKR